jgi:hypothetical protein
MAAISGSGTQSSMSLLTFFCVLCLILRGASVKKRSQTLPMFQTS